MVGTEGEEIHVDEWGRIKVRFLFTRDEDHSHDGGAGSNDNDTDSAWVDVLTPWAGEGYGARFLPRIGEIVVINFFDCNIDRPYVVGRIHEAHRSPTKFDIKGQLPDTKKLSGIRSKEVKGDGFGQLRFDDTTGQISTQLQSSHGASQLNLGNLSHPKEKDTSEGRGEGFELRTDQWGALRAKQGLLLSTYKQDLANGNHLDAKEAKSQLESNLNNSKSLSEVAKNQQTDPLEILDNLKQFIQQIEQESETKAKAFKQAIMVLASPNSIALTTNEDVHLSAEGQISHSASDSINLSTQKNLIAHAQSKVSLFAAQEGARLFAAKGKIEIQAQGDGADLILTNPKVLNQLSPEARKNVDQIRKNLGKQLQEFKKEVDGWLIKSRKTSADANKNSKNQTNKPNSPANGGQKANNTNQGKSNSTNNSSIGQTAITNLSNKFKGILGEHMADYYCQEIKGWGTSTHDKIGTKNSHKLNDNGEMVNLFSIKSRGRGIDGVWKKNNNDAKPYAIIEAKCSQNPAASLRDLLGDANDKNGIDKSIPQQQQRSQNF